MSQTDQSTNAVVRDARLDALFELERADVNDDFAALLDAVESDQDQEHGPVAWLRSRNSLTQLLLTISLASAIGLLAWLFSGRVDMEFYPKDRLATELAALLFTALVISRLALRPLHRAPLPGWSIPLAVVVGAAVPFFLGLMPQAHHMHPASMEGAGTDMWFRAGKCFIYGLSTGLPTAALLFVMDRVGTMNRLVVLGAAAGVGGVLALAVHCPITAPIHLVVGHAPVVLGAVIGAVVVGRMRG